MFKTFAIALLASAVAAGSYDDKPSYGKADYKSYSVSAKISSYGSGISSKVGDMTKGLNERLSKGFEIRFYEFEYKVWMVCRSRFH